jgi:hypothetical protein
VKGKVHWHGYCNCFVTFVVAAFVLGTFGVIAVIVTFGVKVLADAVVIDYLFVFARQSS